EHAGATPRVLSSRNVPARVQQADRTNHRSHIARSADALRWTPTPAAARDRPQTKPVRAWSLPERPAEYACGQSASGLRMNRHHVGVDPQHKTPERPRDRLAGLQWSDCLPAVWRKGEFFR